MSDDQPNFSGIVFEPTISVEVTYTFKLVEPVIDSIHNADIERLERVVVTVSTTWDDPVPYAYRTGYGTRLLPNGKPDRRANNSYGFYPVHPIAVTCEAEALARFKENYTDV
jgi:hypothetical protein